MIQLEYDPQVVSVNPDTFFATYILSPLTLLVAFLLEVRRVLLDYNKVTKVLQHIYEMFVVSKVFQGVYDMMKNLVLSVLNSVNKVFQFLQSLVFDGRVKEVLQKSKEIGVSSYKKVPVLETYVNRGYKIFEEKKDQITNSEFYQRMEIRIKWILEKIKEAIKNLREMVPTTWDQAKELYAKIVKSYLVDNMIFRIVKWYVMIPVRIALFAWNVGMWFTEKFLMHETVVKIVKKVTGYETPKTGVSSQGFTLDVIPKVKEYEHVGKHQIEMKEKHSFGIVLYNYNYKRANCTVKLFGKEIGTFRLDPFSKYTILRPVQQNKPFVFEKAGTLEAEFYPEMFTEPEVQDEKKRKKPSKTQKEKKQPEEKIADSIQKFGKAPVITPDFTKKVTLVVNLVKAG